MFGGKTGSEKNPRKGGTHRDEMYGEFEREVINTIKKSKAGSGRITKKAEDEIESIIEKFVEGKHE